MKKAIYLDYNATTPLAPEVIAEMRPYLTEYFGNPSSAHEYGISAKQAVNKARRQVAALLGTKAENIIFTSGGTEANNQAIKGIAFENQQRGKHIITCSIEHPAVLEVCRYLEKQHGFRITFLQVDSDGLIDLDELRAAICPETILITIMQANNEIGTIQPIAEIAKIARENKIVFHTDAAQSLGKIPVNVEELQVDLLTVAGHKLYAPKGVGALYIRAGVRLEKFMHGAAHENNLRAGTENVLEIVGLGQAAEIASRDLEKNFQQLQATRDLLQKELCRAFPGAQINGSQKFRLPNTLNISLPQLDYYKLMEYFVYVAASAGSACHSASAEISPVLAALRADPDLARKTIRFSTGRQTSKTDILQAVNYLKQVCQM
ncbi:MAG: cysteine desulfurase family protein [Candidatus Cloacimonadales bacterium]